jgi:hypothetical protein
VVVEPSAVEPSATEPAAGGRPVRTRRRVPTPTPSTFGQVRRGVAFSEFGAPTSPPTTSDPAAIAEPNDAGVGPTVESTPTLSIASGAASEPIAQPTEATETGAETVADAPSNPLTLSLVPAAETPDAEDPGASAVSEELTNGQVSAAEAGPAAEASGEPEAAVAAGAASADVETTPGEADAGGAEETAEPAPKPVRRRRTRRPAAPKADVASG